MGGVGGGVKLGPERDPLLVELLDLLESGGGGVAFPAQLLALAERLPSQEAGEEKQNGEQGHEGGEEFAVPVGTAPLELFDSGIEVLGA